MPYYFHKSASDIGKTVYRLTYTDKEDHDVVDVDTIEVLDVLPHKLVIKGTWGMSSSTFEHAIELCAALDCAYLKEIEFCGPRPYNLTDADTTTSLKYIRNIHKICVRDNFFFGSGVLLCALLTHVGDYEFVNSCMNELSWQSFLNVGNVKTLKLDNCTFFSERTLIHMLKNDLSPEILHVYNSSICWANVVHVLDHASDMCVLVIDYSNFSKDFVDEVYDKCPYITLLFRDCDHVMYDKYGVKGIFDRCGNRLADAPVCEQSCDVEVAAKRARLVVA